MDISALMNRKLPQMPPEIAHALRENTITRTRFEEKDRILSDTGLQAEVGYARMDDGAYLVSMICPMPGITADMIRWWFWWHAQDSLRYQLWYPGDHISIAYHSKDRAYFEQPSVPGFAPNTQYPTEKIGRMKAPLRIDFVSPGDFGFSQQAMQEHDIPLIICGHVGAFNNLIRHTEMAHIFKRTEQGLLLISRFWLGTTLKNPLLKKLIITQSMARSMAEHCCIEYRSLREILPALYHANN